MRYLLLALVAVLAALAPWTNARGGHIDEAAFHRLDSIRDEKKKQLYAYFEKILDLADTLSADPAMQTFFHIKNRYFRLQRSGAPPADLIAMIDRLKRSIRDHYLHNYLAFYDILFINPEGDIFFTIRKQSDYHQNIFQHPLSETVLSRQLKAQPGKAFVDYQLYEVSDEPSAFLVRPVFRENRLAGWFVLQCAINKINSMFTQDQELGRTGEVLLVNRQHYMLTDSRFMSDSTILRQHLPEENVAAKFREKIGRKIVTDYRGFRVLSSFEVCRIADSQWLLIAKIDEDEIVAEQFKRRRQSLANRWVSVFQNQEAPPCRPVVMQKRPIEVDMDEFRKASDRQCLCTHGVSSCTAVIVSYPGRFAYMAHISNLDRIYGNPTTDLIGHMLKRIQTFDIYRYELRYLKAVIVAAHLNTVAAVTDRLIDSGFFPSQIKFMHNAAARYGNVMHDYVTNRTSTSWVMDEKADRIVHQCASTTERLGDLIRPLIEGP